MTDFDSYLFLNASPIGLKAITMCRFSLHLFTKNVNNARGEKSAFLSSEAATIAGRTISMMSAFSSVANRLGTSPVFSKLSISSRNDSYNNNDSRKYKYRINSATLLR